MKSSLVLGFALSLLVACTSTEFSEDRQGATVTRPGEKIVIVGADEEFPACVAESLRANDSAHNLMTEQEFRDALFPWFARSFDSRTLSKIIEKPTVKRRLAEIRTRYVVEVTGSTTFNLDNSGGRVFRVSEEGPAPTRAKRALCSAALAQAGPVASG